MYEIVFHNGRSPKYRRFDDYCDDLDSLCALLDALGLPFQVYHDYKVFLWPPAWGVSTAPPTGRQ